jgi:hypothetical protein
MDTVFSSSASYAYLVVNGGSFAYLQYVQASQLSFAVPVSSTTATPLVLMNGSSTVEFISGTYNGITSLSNSGGVFSDLRTSSASATVVVKLKDATFQGAFLFLSSFLFFFFMIEPCSNLNHHVYVCIIFLQVFPLQHRCMAWWGRCSGVSRAA